MHSEISPAHDHTSQLLPPPRSSTAGVALTNAEYRALVEHSPVMIWRARPDGLCDYLNETWLAFTGRTLGQEISAGSAVDVHPDDSTQTAERYRDAFAKRQDFEMEYRLRRHD